MPSAHRYFRRQSLPSLDMRDHKGAPATPVASLDMRCAGEAAVADGLTCQRFAASHKQRHPEICVGRLRPRRPKRPWICVTTLISHDGPGDGAGEPDRPEICAERQRPSSPKASLDMRASPTLMTGRAEARGAGASQDMRAGLRIKSAYLGTKSSITAKAEEGRGGGLQPPIRYRMAFQMIVNDNRMTRCEIVISSDVTARSVLLASEILDPGFVQQAFHVLDLPGHSSVVRVGFFQPHFQKWVAGRPVGRQFALYA